jgi:glyoxylase I family protein
LYKIKYFAVKIEHFALNVSDPLSMANWYCAHLGFSLASQMEVAPYTCFLADDSGNVMIEIYNNPADKVPDFANMDPLLCHIAFVSENPASDRLRLQQAGASFVSESNPGDGTHLIMLRDPWGLAIQLCKRAKPMLKMQH